MERSSRRVKLDTLFNQLPELAASDLHLKADSPPVFRIGGQLHRAKAEPLSSKQIDSLIGEWLGPQKTAELYEKGSLDIGYDLDWGRVRVNVFLQRGKISLVARLIKEKIPTLEELHLPPGLARIVDMNQGLILVCGITGCGKSTTLACLIEMINLKQRCHILTIEDPIEYMYHDKKSIVNQREIGVDCRDWADALRAAVREDPDVILVGELRDHETFQAGLVAAETGHLVFGTLHTSSVAGTLGRILDLFPAERHHLIRQSLSMNLRSICCQMLVPSYREVGLVPAVELMFTNAAVSKAVAEGDDSRMTELIAVGREEGMQTWTQSFADLVKKNYIEKRVGREFAPNKDAFEMALKGIDITQRSIG